MGQSNSIFQHDHRYGHDGHQSIDGRPGRDELIGWAVGAVLLAVAAFAVYSAFQSPTFVAGLSALAAAAAWKAIKPVVTKRNSPEIEARMRECVRRGGEWDNFKKRCRD